MSLRIYNTLTREKEPFKPLDPKLVRMYLCGPTVYSDSHIGHLMGPVLFDTVARWLKARGYELRFVVNITDIDDKIIQRGLEDGEPWDAVAKRYTAKWMDHIRELGVTTITDHPHCTEYVPQMIAFIEKLMAEDKAYVAGDGVYYDVQQQPNYGKLSGRKLEDMRSEARVAAAAGLRHAADFALWKFAKPGEPEWPSPWGPGRPGWHIECSVMASELLGGAFDIHAGGDDLKFPHHENEIAQSEAHGDAYAQRWMHHGLVQFGGRKVAKSDPRMQDPDFAKQFQAWWLLETYGGPVLRYYLIRSPYRRPVDFEPGNLQAAVSGLERLHRQLGGLLTEPLAGNPAEVLTRELSASLAVRRQRFVEAMDDDFNSGEAVAVLHSIEKDARGLEGEERREALLLMRDLGRILGLLMPDDPGKMPRGAPVDETLARVIEATLNLRKGAREKRDFATADGLRDLLGECGVSVQDSGDGSGWDLDSKTSKDALEGLLGGLMSMRDGARAARDFELSDALRDELVAAGISVLDSSEGSRWEID